MDLFNSINEGVLKYVHLDNKFRRINSSVFLSCQAVVSAVG